jgi:hypothetical protein
MGAFDDLIPGKPSEGGGTFDDLIPKASIGGAAKNFGASAIEGIGSIAQGGGEAVAAGLNALTSSQNFRATNPLKGVADYLKDSMSSGDKAAMADQAKGNVFQPDSWVMPQTAGGYVHAAANALGSLVPTLATAAAARGNMSRAMAAQGGLMTGGAAAGDIRENIDKLDTDEKLAAASPAFARLVAGGMIPAEARSKVANESAQFGALGSGVAGAIGGGINARLLEDLIAKKGIPALLGNKLADHGVARTLTGAGLGAIGEGAQEVAEKIGQNAGENVGMGKSLTDDVGRDTLGDFVGGAIGGKVAGGVGGYLAKPRVATPTGVQIDPTAGPISSAAASAINSGAAQRHADTAAQEQATQQQAEKQAEAQKQQDAEAKAFAGKPQFDDPVKWWQALNGAGQTALVQKLDGEERQTALELMATARDPRTSEPIRERAVGMLYGIAQNIGLPGTAAPVSPLALPAPKPDQNQIGRDNIAKWSEESQALALADAQELQARAAADGRDDMVVVPHGSGQGYTIVPKAWVGNTDASKEAGALQGKGNGQLPSPEAPRAATTVTKPSTSAAPGPVEGEYIRGRQAAEQYFPFRNAQQAEARAMTATKEFGEEYGIEPHPSVKGAFAVVPASKAQSNTTSPSVMSDKSSDQQVTQAKLPASSAVAPASAGTVLSNKKQLFRETPIAQGAAPQLGQTQEAGESAVAPKENGASTKKLLTAPVGEADSSAVTPESAEQKIREHIAKQAINASLKSYAVSVKKGHMTQEFVDGQMAKIRKDYESSPASDRTKAIGKAIAEKDPAPLVRAWAREGSSTFGSEGSVAAFKELTGVNLKGSAKARQDALYDWAGWSSEQRAADREAIAASDKKSAIARNEKSQAREDEAATTGADRMPVTEKETGKSLGTIKTWIDGLIERGFNRVVKEKKGAITKTLLVDEEGKGYPLGHETARRYADVAVRLAAKAKDGEPKYAAKPVNDPDIARAFQGLRVEQGKPNDGITPEAIDAKAEEVLAALDATPGGRASFAFDKEKIKALIQERGVAAADKTIQAAKDQVAKAEKTNKWYEAIQAKKKEQSNDGIPESAAPTVRDERAASDSAVAPDKPTGSPERKARSVIGANKRAGVAATDVANSAASVADADQPQSDGAGIATPPEIVALHTRKSVLESLKACLG